jgi:hypothetical protein
MSIQAERINEMVSEMQGEIGQLRAMVLWFIEQHSDNNGAVWIPWTDIARLNHAMQNNYAPVNVNSVRHTRNPKETGGVLREESYMVVKANLKRG